MHQFAENGRMVPRNDSLLAAKLGRLDKLPGVPLAKWRPALAELVQPSVNKLANLP
jgi:hypothetical protein